MAGFLYAECYDYGNFENKVKRYRLWRRDGRAAADSKRLLPHFNFVRGILAALLVGSERLREQSVSA